MRRADPAATKIMRTPKVVPFGDLPNFSTLNALNDNALLAFYTGPMAAMGWVIDDAAPAYRKRGVTLSSWFSTIPPRPHCVHSACVRLAASQFSHLWSFVRTFCRG